MAFAKQHFVDGSTLITAAWLNGIQEVVGAAAVCPEYDSTQVYAVGSLCSYNGNMYRCKTAITVAEMWNPAHWEATSLQTLLAEKENVILKILNVSVVSSAWSSWVYAPEEQTLHNDYPWRASITLTGVTAAMLPEVVFDYDAIKSGNFAPVATSGEDCLYIYASVKPVGTTKIQSIIFFGGDGEYDLDSDVVTDSEIDDLFT